MELANTQFEHPRFNSDLIIGQTNRYSYRIHFDKILSIKIKLY